MVTGSRRSWPHPVEMAIVLQHIRRAGPSSTPTHVKENKRTHIHIHIYTYTMSDTKFQASTPAFTANHPTTSPDQHYYQGQTEAPVPPYQQGTPDYVAPQPVQLNTYGNSHNTHGNSQYLHATPLTALTRGPAPVDCPMCGRRALTATTLSTGNFTQ